MHYFIVKKLQLVECVSMKKLPPLIYLFSEMGDVQINLEKPGEKTQEDGEVKGDLNIDPDLDRFV